MRAGWLIAGVLLVGVGVFLETRGTAAGGGLDFHTSRLKSGAAAELVYATAALDVPTPGPVPPAPQPGPDGEEEAEGAGADEAAATDFPPPPPPDELPEAADRPPALAVEPLASSEPAEVAPHPPSDLSPAAAAAREGWIHYDAPPASSSSGGSCASGNCGRRLRLFGRR